MVWNSVMSTLSAPSKRRDAVREEITWPTRRLRLVGGRSMSRDLRQMSRWPRCRDDGDAVCSRREWVESTEL